MAFDVFMSFVGTMTNPVVWLVALALVVIVSRAVVVRVAGAGVAAAWGAIDAAALDEPVRQAATVATSALAGLAVAEFVLIIVLPALLLSLGAGIRALVFAKRAAARLRGARPAQERDPG